MLLRDDFTITYLLLIGTEVIDLLNTRSLSSTCWFTNLLNVTNMHGRCHKQPIIGLGCRVGSLTFLPKVGAGFFYIQKHVFGFLEVFGVVFLSRTLVKMLQGQSYEIEAPGYHTF